MTPQLTTLRAEAAHARTIANQWQHEVERLNTVLSQSSDDLVEAIASVLAGDTSANFNMALIWARLGRERRLKLLPIVDAVVRSEFQQQIGVLPPDDEDAVIRGFAFLERVEWLKEALDPDAGGAYRLRNLRDDPLEKTFRRLAVDVLLRRYALTQESPEVPGLGLTPEEARGRIRNLGEVLARSNGSARVLSVT
jgi:hypothetical protein